MQVSLDGKILQYEDTKSDKRVIVMLHGWGDSLKTFTKLKHQLEPNFRLIIVDLPGFGGSEATYEPAFLSTYSLTIASFLHKIDVKDVYAFIGHSNGGAIAIKGLADGTISSKKLVLLASSGIRSTYNGRRKALRLTVKLAKIPTLLLSSKMQLKLKKKVYNIIGSDLFVAEHMQETFKNIISEDLLKPAENINQPTLLVYGIADEATPVSYGEAFRKAIPQAKLEVIDGAGHFLHQSHTDDVGKIIKKFLSA